MINELVMNLQRRVCFKEGVINGLGLGYLIRPGRFARARRAGQFFQNHRSKAGAVILLTLFISSLSALEPLLLKYIFDNLSSINHEGTARILATGILLLALLGVTRESISSLTNWLTWRTRLGVHQQMLEALVTRLHLLPISFYRSESVGAILTKLDRGVQGVVEAASQLAFNVIPSVIYLLITIVVMIQLDWRLALLVLFFSPLQPLMTAWAAPRQTARERGLLERWVKIYSRFNEVLSSIVTVKSFTQEEAEKKKFITDVSAANQAVIKGVAFDSRVQAVQNLVVTLAHVTAIGLGGYLAYRQEITIGTLVAFLGYLSGIFTPVQGLSGIYRTIRTASVSLDAVFSILDAQDQLGDSPDAVALPAIRGDVRFENVRFGYSPERSILNSINLDVKAGEMVAIVGPSGSGKSTLMALMQRFYDPIDGSVLVDGVDIRTIKQRSLRKQIGVVLQESLLFDDTIYHNIAYGRPDATREEIERVAKIANAHDFILRLPEGYETRVGERGSRLSAGERQRVAIARALLKDPPILVLDEATSALDAESEALVQQAIDLLIRGRTTFVIAHRLSTVVTADRVCLLINGQIADSLPHLELMEKNSYYASLVQQQTRGLLPDHFPEPRKGLPDRRRLLR